MHACMHTYIHTYIYLFMSTRLWTGFDPEFSCQNSTHVSFCIHLFIVAGWSAINNSWLVLVHEAKRSRIGYVLHVFRCFWSCSDCSAIWSELICRRFSGSTTTWTFPYSGPGICRLPSSGFSPLLPWDDGRDGDGWSTQRRGCQVLVGPMVSPMVQWWFEHIYDSNISNNKKLHVWIETLRKTAEFLTEWLNFIVTFHSYNRNDSNDTNGYSHCHYCCDSQKNGLTVFRFSFRMVESRGVTNWMTDIFRCQLGDVYIYPLVN